MEPALAHPQILRYCSRKRIPAVTVYIIFTNRQNLDLLRSLFSGLPCRLILLQATDFETGSSLLPYPTIGVDRMAAILATAGTARPALILDGGTAMTSTVVGSDGSFQGGGISPGLGAKFRALHEFTGALPRFDPAHVAACVAARLPRDAEGGDQNNHNNHNNRPLLPPFSMMDAITNTEDAMIGAVLKETAVYVTSMAHHFVHTHGAAVQPPCDQQPHNGNNNNKFNPTIFVTGSDGPVVTALLGPHSGRIVEWGAHDTPFCAGDEETTPTLKAKTTTVPVLYDKYLLHRGIQQALLTRPHPADDDRSRVHHALMGQRVARAFDGCPASDGDTVYRGVVVSGQYETRLDEDFFRVTYDDGDMEELDPEQLYRKWCVGVFLFFL
jgi:hypothetical protein